MLSHGGVDHRDKELIPAYAAEHKGDLKLPILFLRPQKDTKSF